MPISLSPLQAAMTSIMEATLTIQRNSSGAWSNVTTTPGRFYQFNILPQENPSQTQRLYIDDRWRFILPVGTDVRFGDRIKYGTRTWEVIQVTVGSLPLYLLTIAQELGA